METESQLQVSSNSGQPKEGTSFFKACFNGINTLAGIGMLSMPYAVSEGGWLSFMMLFIFAMICQVAFGYKGRAVIASFIYLELFLIAVELLILEALVVLPTTWLRSLGALAYISVGGIFASVILIGCVLWVGEVDGVGFHERGKLVNLEGLSTAMSLFAFCYCAHALLPTICNSMKDRKQFSKVLLVCFVASTIIYGTVAVLGYRMFGDHLKSQITLNLPTNTISTKIAIYTTVINPFTKYPIVITPITNAIEEKWHLCKSRPISILFRTTIVVSSVLVALFVPFFGYIMAFIGAFLSVAISLLFPCLCYLKIHKAARRFGLELIIIIGILIIGTLIGIHAARFRGPYFNLEKQHLDLVCYSVIIGEKAATGMKFESAQASLRASP
ncbi:vacuolar amino acid transporter 1-like protein [Trifolium pratense]|uniref:Vacuolar amino acid transporter 1-like protein n=1 Tax=Trifolium pratense TaxID=57577 RepID=A0A2K3PBL4_TRIPR|nr:vacuolar amino acid transporter 1-like protein [Trifolium pratense]